MYVQNIANKDLILNVKGHSVIIKAGSIQYIPDCLVTEKDIRGMFNDSLVILTGIDKPKEFMGVSEQKIEAGTLYIAQLTSPNVPARIFVSGGPVDVFGSDSTLEPKSFSEMSCPESCMGIEGVNYFSIVPKFIAAQGGASEIVVTNMKCYEVGPVL